jgi:hypothetical protein
MLAACILSAVDAAGRAVAVEALLDALRAPLEGAIRALDLGADDELPLECPACGTTFPALLDGFALLAAAATPAEALLREIDAIARAYHWREPDILALPVLRRRRYLALVEARAARERAA